MTHSILLTFGTISVLAGPKRTGPANGRKGPCLSLKSVKPTITLARTKKFFKVVGGNNKFFQHFLTNYLVNFYFKLAL